MARNAFHEFHPVTLASALVASVVGLIAAGAPDARAADVPQVQVEQYARLHVALTITSQDANASKTISLSGCPKKSTNWPLQTGGWLTDTESTIGVKIDAPDGTSQVLNPVDIKISDDFLSNTCSIAIDRIDYLSPLWYVRKTTPKYFHVVPVLTTSDQIDPDAIASLDNFLTSVAPIAGVPGPAAATVTGAVRTLATGVKLSSQDAQGVTFHIQAGAAQSQDWSVSDILPQKGYNVTISAGIETQDTLIPAPANSNWTRGDVFNASFPVGLTGTAQASDTLGDFIQTFASAEINHFSQQSTLATLSVACDTLRAKVDSVGLTDGDTAKLMWALIEDHPALADGSHDSDLMAMHCVQDLTPHMPAGMYLPAKAVATIAQMEAAVGGDDSDLWNFITASTWNGRKDLGSSLFVYPARINDTGKLLFGSDTLADNNAWGTDMPNRDQQILSQLGCYTYFVNDGKNAASKIGTESVMFAIGVTPANSATPNKEVAVAFSFVPTDVNGTTSINQIDVSDTLWPDAKAAMSQRFAGQGHCANGFKPAMLFGP